MNKVNIIDRRTLYNDFLKVFPIEKLSNLTLDEYTGLKNVNTFCYWLERRTDRLGRITSGTLDKFGIYQYADIPKKRSIKSDSKFAWKENLGSTSEDAFKKVRNAIVSIAKYANDGKWEEIEKIDVFGQLVTWKIAFLYSKEKLIPIYSKDKWLVPIVSKLGLENAHSCSVSQLYRFLISKKGNKDLYDFYDELCTIKGREIIEEEKILNDIEIPLKKYDKYIELLFSTYNLVLTGAPGTGKTYMTREIAKEMGAEVEFVQFHPSYDYTDFVEGLRPIEKNDGQIGFERKDGVFKEFCKRAIKNLLDSKKSVENLTKEKSWEEKLNQFVENAIDSGATYETVSGSKFTITEVRNRALVVHNEQNEKTTDIVVNLDEMLTLLTNEVELDIIKDIKKYFNRKFATQADSYTFAIVREVREFKQDFVKEDVDVIKKKDFVFIIDEINRGEASKIFGELFYAIDPGYRGDNKNNRVKTQYQNLISESDVFADGFYVPENVYILATMNDIDRSVESMDFAMRRRFTWKEIKPSDTVGMLDDLGCKDEAKMRMEWLNEAIAKVDGLGRAYMIGPAYFLKLKDNNGDFDALWDMNLNPLLNEYLRGFRKADEILEDLKNIYDGVNVGDDNEN